MIVVDLCRCGRNGNVEISDYRYGRSRKDWEFCAADLAGAGFVCSKCRSERKKAQEASKGEVKFGRYCNERIIDNWKQLTGFTVYLCTHNTACNCASDCVGRDFRTEYVCGAQVLSKYIHGRDAVLLRHNHFYVRDDGQVCAKDIELSDVDNDVIVAEIEQAVQEMLDEQVKGASDGSVKHE
jgi:hypothetical protein